MVCDPTHAMDVNEENFEGLGHYIQNNRAKMSPSLSKFL